MISLIIISRCLILINALFKSYHRLLYLNRIIGCENVCGQIKLRDTHSIMLFFCEKFIQNFKNY